MTILLVTEDFAIQRNFQFALQLDVKSCLRSCKTYQAAEELLRKHRDIELIAIDFSVTDLDGLKGVERLKKMRPSACVVLISHTTSHAIARQALRIGVSAFVPADVQGDEIEQVISLAKGKRDVILLQPSPRQPQSKNNVLSRREHQILSLLCDGQQNKEIAHTFGIQEVTVKMHMRSVIRKLGARNRTHAAMIARDQDLV